MRLADLMRSAKRKARTSQRAATLVGKRVVRDAETLIIESHDRETCTVVTVDVYGRQRSWRESDFLSAVCEVIG